MKKEEITIKEFFERQDLKMPEWAWWVLIIALCLL